jgi:hypothetical protein
MTMISTIVNYSTLRKTAEVSRFSSVGQKLSAMESDLLNGSKARSFSAKSIQENYHRERNLEEILFDSRANAKIEFSKISMYLDESFRLGFFRQIDSLLDIEEWNHDDLPIEGESVRTLLKVILAIGFDRKPGLGSSGLGDIIASWTQKDWRFSVRCFPSDRVHWTVRKEVKGVFETGSGQTVVEELKNIKHAYRLELNGKNFEEKN